uniref:NB-ARC domain-containing protein n=1 Tax=Setaria italica TaxID=4555 RepID=K3ZNG3_SETIT
MEATALSVGKSVLNGALGYAKSAFAEEVALQLGIQRDHAFVSDELEMMQSFMMEAHEERDDNKVVKTWVKQVRDTAYDVEDSLQDFAVRVERPSWWRFPRTLLERRRVAMKMKELRAKVEDVSQRNVRYRLIKGSGSKATAATELSSIIAAAIFGVDDAKEENRRVDLLQLINKECDDLRVIAVWGTGGDMGQTKFPSRAWVRVTHPFSSKGFVQSLVNQFLAVEGFKDILDTEKTAHDLVQEFDGYVKEKRFLIVLTDLCTIEEWDQIEKCLPNNNKGSRIIVSTTQVEVASLCAGQDSQASELSNCTHNLKKITTRRRSLKVSQNEMVSVDPVSSPDVVTASTNAQTVAPSEITEDQCKNVDETKVDKKSLTRIRAGVGLISNKASQQCQVISIWGMGGLEKTTLANGIYQSPKLNLLRSLVGRLQEESSKKEELLNNRYSKTESLAMMGVKNFTKELKRLLEKKSCLIVLDDLSSIEEWDHIIQGEESIAKHCSGNYGIVHNLEVLKEEDALNLFSLKATDLIRKNPELVEETKKILKKCGGLPLAIVTIGGYLASRPKTRAEWRKLNENISAELEMNPELGMIRTVLQTSYDGLPYELKSCFLYLSIFPEDHIISQRRLVSRWTAEGYSHERRGKSANVMAENYFTELKYRSMILPFQQSVRSTKSIDPCKVHDLIRDIAISKSMEENLVFRLEEGCGLSTHGAIRRLAIRSNWKGDQSELERIVDVPFYISDKMRLLRVLDLEGIDDYQKYYIQSHQLDHIWKLLHLKYLSLRGCFRIYLLPDSLGNLRQLQVLDVKGTSVMALPKTIIMLRKLQYINAGQISDYVTLEKDSLTRRCLWGARQCATCCVPLLRDIDGSLHKALTRRDACTFACCVLFPAVMTGVHEERGAMVPRGTRKLKELHTFRGVHVGRGNAVLQDIKMLTGLRKLGVAGINRKNGPAFRAAISNLSRLESLSVSSAGKPGLHGCLESLYPPPENLQSLRLYGNLETLPKWIKELPHLVKLKLVSTRLLEHDAAMEFLGKMSKLEILSLSRQSFQGEELRFRSQQTGRAFGSLRVLMLDIEYIKSVKFEEGIMPKLELLQVIGEANNEIGFSGLEFLQSINEVQLSNNNGWLKKKIQELLAGNRNEPIVTVY